MADSSFEYSGHLVFSFYMARFKDQWCSHSEFITELLQRLSEYKEGTPENPEEGYTKIELLNQADAGLELPGWMLEEFEEWVCIQYHYEEYHTEEAFVDDGEKKEVFVPSIETVDLYFHPSGLTLVRGKDSAIHQVTSQLQQAADGDLLFDRITIDSQELYEFQNPDINVKQTRKAAFNSVKASTDRVSITGRDVSSDPVLERSRKRGQIIRHMGKVQFRDFALSVDTRQDRIFIRSLYDLKNLTDESRLVLGILFCHRVLEPQIKKEKGDLS